MKIAIFVKKKGIFCSMKLIKNIFYIFLRECSNNRSVYVNNNINNLNKKINNSDNLNKKNHSLNISNIFLNTLYLFNNLSFSNSKKSCLSFGK